jgi:TolB protein
MQKSRLPLLILLLVLACVLCLCAAVTGFAVFQVLRSVTDVDLPQMQALQPPLEQPDTLDALPDATRLSLAARAGASVNRIVVQGADGNVYTIRPDGTGRIPLTQDGAELRIYRQPAWSPDAARVAWVEVAGSDSGLTSALVTGRPDAGAQTRVDMGDNPPFYLSWSPDGGRIAALGSADRGLALRSIDVTGEEAPAVLAQAQPLYFAWSPDGARLVAHLNGETVSLLSTDGSETPLGGQSAAFGAPEWMADGAAFVYAQRLAGTQQLVLADPSGATLRDLAAFDGTITFSLSPDGERVAFIDSTEMVPTAALGPLSLASLSGAATPQVIDDGPVLAFFWSPQGDKLAYLTPGDHSQQGPRASLSPTLEADHLNLWLQWHVWDGERSYELAQFRPSDTFLVDYLRFFDQYARSMTPWAPDGSAFVYTGDSEDAISGVWVQPVIEGAPSVRIGDGVYAAWSPR